MTDSRELASEAIVSMVFVDENNVPCNLGERDGSLGNIRHRISGAGACSCMSLYNESAETVPAIAANNQITAAASDLNAAGSELWKLVLSAVNRSLEFQDTIGINTKCFTSVK